MAIPVREEDIRRFPDFDAVEEANAFLLDLLGSRASDVESHWEYDRPSESYVLTLKLPSGFERGAEIARREIIARWRTRFTIARLWGDMLERIFTEEVGIRCPGS